MPKVKIPRKSTTIDMTAMCDVAFLLLSFFILATKQKPPEVLAVAPPNSVSAEAAPDKAFIITLTKEGKAFLMLGEETKKKEVIDSVNVQQGLGLGPDELKALNRAEFIGIPFSQLKGYLSAVTKPSPKDLPGIPLDTAKNELQGWFRAITSAYAGEDMSELQKIILIKGDNTVKYPAFRGVKEALKHNDIYKFRIITNGEAVPLGSELYNSQKASETGSGGAPAKK